VTTDHVYVFGSTGGALTVAVLPGRRPHDVAATVDLTPLIRRRTWLLQGPAARPAAAQWLW
jgi:hypothetical protein